MKELVGYITNKLASGVAVVEAAPYYKFKTPLGMGFKLGQKVYIRYDIINKEVVHISDTPLSETEVVVLAPEKAVGEMYLTKEDFVVVAIVDEYITLSVEEN